MIKITVDRIIKISIAVGIIVVSLSLFYHLTIYLPEENKIAAEQQKQERLIKEQKDQADDLFQKNIECMKHKDAILKQEDQYNKNQKPEIRDSNNAGGDPIYNLYVENNSLKEIFYSPKVNSCLYLESKRTLIKRGADAKPDIGEWGIEYETYYLIDELTGKEIDFNDGLSFLQIIHRGEVFHSEEDIEALISKYK